MVVITILRCVARTASGGDSKGEQMNDNMILVIVRIREEGRLDEAMIHDLPHEKRIDDGLSVRRIVLLPETREPD